MKNLYYLIIGLLFIFNTSCGSGDKAASEMVESIIEEASGEDVDIEIDEEGNGVNMTIKTDEGTMEINTDSKELPDDFPSDIYVVEGERVSVSVMNSDDEKAVVFQVLAESDIAAAAETIKSGMSGWDNEVEMSTGGQVMLSYSKENQSSCTVTISKDDEGKTLVNYIVGYRTE